MAICVLLTERFPNLRGRGNCINYGLLCRMSGLVLLETLSVRARLVGFRLSANGFDDFCSSVGRVRTAGVTGRSDSHVRQKLQITFIKHAMSSQANVRIPISALGQKVVTHEANERSERGADCWSGAGRGCEQATPSLRYRHLSAYFPPRVI